MIAMTYEYHWTTDCGMEGREPLTRDEALDLIRDAERVPSCEGRGERVWHVAEDDINHWLTIRAERLVEPQPGFPGELAKGYISRGTPRSASKMARVPTSNELGELERLGFRQCYWGTAYVKVTRCPVNGDGHYSTHQWLKDADGTTVGSVERHGPRGEL